MSWKSLDQIYLNESAGRKVKKLPRQEIIGENIQIFKGENGRYDYIGTVDDKELKKISRIAGNKNDKVIIDYVSSKNYSKDAFNKEFFFKSLITLLENYSFDDYIGRDNKPKVLDNKIGNLVDIGTQIGLDDTFLRELANFTAVDKGGSNIGPGEIMLALVFDDIKNSTVGGDLMLKDKQKLEVKGQGGRFGQQGGRSGQTVAFDKLLNGIEEKVEIAQNSSMAQTFNNVYNVYKKENKLDKFLGNLYEFIKQFYPNGEPEIFLNKSTNFNDIVDIRRNIQKIYSNNYLNQYDYDLLLFIDKNKLNYALFSKEDLIGNGGLIDEGRFKTNNFRFNELYPNNHLPELKK